MKQYPLLIKVEYNNNVSPDIIPCDSIDEAIYLLRNKKTMELESPWREIVGTVTQLFIVDNLPGFPIKECLYV